MAIRINLSDKIFFLVLGLIFFLYEIEAKKAATADANAPAEFDVTKFDAKGDGKAESTEEGENANSLAFIQAWQKACNSIGPSRLVIPKGKFVVAQVLFSGPCQSQVTVDLMGDITADSDPSVFPNQELIVFQQVEGAKLIGTGTINVNQPPTAADPEKDYLFSEVMPSIKFKNATACTVDGIHSLNPSAFHVLIQNSNNIIIQNTNFDTVIPLAPNSHTNAVYIVGSTLVGVKNSYIRTGDDCVTVSGGSSDVTIMGVTCVDGQGISIGAQLDGAQPIYDVKGVNVKNCTFKGTKSGVKVNPRPRDKPAQISGITFEDIVMDNTLNPIAVKSDFPPVADKIHFAKILDVHFRNIRGTTSTPSAAAFNCDKSSPCEDIEVADVTLSLSEKVPIGAPALLSAVCANAKVKFSGNHEGLVCP